MQYFDNITEAAEAVNEWFWTNKASMAEDLVGIVQPYVGPTKSAVDLVVNTAEGIYARRDNLDAATLQLAAGLAAFAGVWGFHGMADDNRGQRMAFALRRDSGEEAPLGTEWPDPSQDPEVKGAAQPPAPLEIPAESAMGEGEQTEG